MRDEESRQKKESIRNISNEIKLYIEKRIELLILDVGEEFSKIAARSIYQSLGIVITAVAFILALFSLALFLGNLLHNESLGFLLTSIPVFIIGILFLILRPRKLLYKVSDRIFDMILQSYNNMSGKEKPKELQSKN
jgi:hypothetical protein